MAHDSLASLVVDALMCGSRSISRETIHTEERISALPQRYGLGDLTTGRGRSAIGMLTPDVVGADLCAGELLVVEVTIVPDGALGRYANMKRRKYAPLATAAANVEDAPTLKVLPPLVVAVSESGALFEAEAVTAALGLDALAAERFANQAARIARARPPTGRRRR